ncbi:MAG: response regulator [Phycisphaerales bacterium]|nr:MAG: response regulator [Phycisphaerales bacterium]
MNNLERETTHRILIIDDNPSIHKDFETILLEEDESTSLNTLRSEVLGDEVVNRAARNVYDLDFASQGQEGCQKIDQARAKGCPYEVVFVDMRMPPGWDGLKTIENIWKIDPGLQVVICTAYSDYSWADITDRLGKSDNLLILKKPFDAAEVAQLASALTEKWVLARQASMKMEQLANMVKERTGELEQINEQLREEIAERKQAQQSQAALIKTVEAINKDLKDFAYIVSHDLKAPLRGIKSLATWILDDSADQLGEQAKQQMHLLLDRVELMHQLIEGVLKYSRASNAKEEPVRVDLNQFVPEVIDMLNPPDSITIAVQDDMPVIDCQEAQLMQLFQNLLSNAIKYMDKSQGRINVGCTEENGFWKFSIADNGPGIEERHFEKIFQMFQSLPVIGDSDLSGTGIGLTVAKKIVELHGGSICVESKVGEGSTFFFTLPRQETGVDNAKLEANIAC